MMATSKAPDDKGCRTPYQYLDAAVADYVAGDLKGSSEKMWLASEMAATVVAESRGWSRSTTADLEKVVMRLDRENGGEATLWGKWAVATILRDNIREDFLEPVEVRAARPSVLQLVGNLLAHANRKHSAL